MANIKPCLECIIGVPVGLWVESSGNTT